MKKLFFLIISFIGVTTLNAQILLNTNLGQIDTCDNIILYDSGDSTGNYGMNESYTVTFCPTVPNSRIQLEILFWDVNDQYDVMCLYNGNSTAAPLLNCFAHNGVTSVINQASATNTSGCITLEWTTNGAGTAAGWAVQVSCILPCQQIVPELVSSTPASVPLVNGYIDICPNEIVSFSGQANYPENNTFYPQSNATSTFVWTIDGVQYTGQNASHRFTRPGGYKVQLKITDTQGCVNTTSLDLRVRVAPPPIFTGTNTNQNTICIGDTITLQGIVTQQTGNFATGGFIVDTIHLIDPPHNSTLTQTTSIIIDGFLPGQTLNNLAEFGQICANLEHDATRQIDIELVCPNGQSVILHQNTTTVFPQINGGFGLGTGQTNDPPVAGLNYCWTPFTFTGTINDTAAIPWSLGNPFPPGVVPPGLYSSDSSFSNLIGCPLNGQWTLNITDYDHQGDGYLYNWGLDFPLSTYPSTESFTPQTISKQWLTDSTIISSVGDSVIIAVPTEVGVASYTFSVTNDYSCAYDTTITVQVLGLTDGACLACDSILISPNMPDTSICLGETTQVDATVPNPYNIRTFTYSSSGLAIPSHDTTWSQIQVMNVFPTPFNTLYLQSICIDIEHNNPEDLDIYLIAPNGYAIELSTDNGAGTPNAYHNTCFKAGGTTNIVFATPPYTGNYTAEGSLNALNIINLNPNGIWKLMIIDDNNYAADGVLNNWSIAFKNQPNPTYTWTNHTADLSCTTCPNPIITTTSTKNYIVKIENTYGCTVYDTIAVNVANPILSVTTQNITCPLGNDGSLTLSANSIVGIAQYFYQDNTTTDSSTTGIFNNLTAGNYLITATDNIGCTDTMTVILTEPTPIIPNETIINNACFGENNGSIILNPTGGTPPFSYFWSDNSTNNSLVNLSSDNYLVTITDGANCIVNTNFNINQPDSISTILTTTMTTDCNGNDGTATVTATGGMPNYTYLWHNNDNIATANNLTSGTATVTVTDANNCVKIDSVTVLAPEPITFSVNHTDLICHTNNLNGTPLGTITINILSGTTYPNYEYSIDCGATWQNSNVFTNLSVGNYDATVRYSNATCQTTCQSITITQPDSLDLSFTTSQVTCYGLSDGTATVFAVGGNGNFSYLWNILMNNNNQNTATAINLQGGFFEVTVTDGNTCQTSDTVYVYAPVLVNIDNLSSTPTLCYGSNEGTISGSASGGTGAKNYTWTTNSNQNYTGSSVTNLYAGNYILTAADQQGCIAMDSVLVTQPDSLAATFTVDSLTCFNNNSGSATVSVLGGTPSYSFIWNNNANINQANNLPSAFAIVTITDANNCVLTDSVFVPQPLPLSLNFTTTQVTCNGANDGTATVTASGGTGNCTYLWANNSQNNIVNNLSGGGYTVTVSDANNCSANGSVFVLENPALSVLENKNNVSCFNNNDGNITLLPNGGTGIYTFQWQNSTGNLNITDSILNNISVGIYTYIVTDSDGCNYSDTVEITEPQPLGVTLISINPTCLGGANGTATATVSGGTSPYNYTWSRQSQNAATVQNLTGGWINLTVTDANNCTIIDSVFVQQPVPISITTTSIPTTCIGSNDSTAMAIVTGGLGNYTYIWTTQNGQNLHQNTATATNLQSGQYFVAATDTNNCTVTDSVFVSEPEPLDVTPTFTPISCFGANDGSIYLIIENINNYTFQWNTNPTDTFYFINNLESKNYIVTITDSLNCVFRDTIFIDEPTEIISNFEIKNISCNGKNNGEIKIQTTGGTPFYQYNFANNGFSNTNCFIGLSPNNYEIITKDANGCEVTDTIEITEPQAVEVNLGDDILTELGNQIEVTATVTNGIFPFIYHWHPADSLLSCVDCSDVIITTNDAIKRYDCIVTDANGCIGEDFIIIRTNKKQTIFVANAFTPNGDGNNDVLFVQGSESIAKTTFQVFDRWGELVFETKDAPINDENYGWNGNLGNEKMNSGIFVWVAEVTFEDGSVEIFRGSVFLMR